MESTSNAVAGWIIEESFQTDMNGLNTLPSAFETNPNAPLGRNESFSSGKPPPPGVKYRVEYLHSYSNKIVHSAHTDVLNYSPEGDADSVHKIFDIVTTFRTTDAEFGKPEESEGRKAPRITDTRKAVDMHIHSPAIIHTLRSVVDYYPGQDLLGETLVIPAPYAILVHHEKELNEFKERCSPSNQTQSSSCPKEQHAYQDLKILQDFLEETIMPAVRVERARNERGLETYNMMWLRMKPGATILLSLAGCRKESQRGAIISSLGGGTLGFGSSAWSVTYWTLDYNGTFIGTSTDSFLVRKFEGERSTNHDPALDVVEDSAFNEPMDSFITDLVERGKTFYNLLSKKCQYYKGTTFDFPYHQVSFDSSNPTYFFRYQEIGRHYSLFDLQIDGLVMVDIKGYYLDVDSELDNQTKPFVTQLPLERSWISDCSCNVCMQKKEQNAQQEKQLVAFEHYHGIYPEHLDNLTPHQYLLLPPKLWGFVFKRRSWGKQ
jgi:hypothetical protein